MIFWRQRHNYCFVCRDRHSELKNDPETLCDKTNKCEVIKHWWEVIDGKDVKHDEPFYLYPENNMAMEIYERIVMLSNLQEFQWMRGKKPMRGYYPNLSALPFVLDYYLPPGFSDSEFDLLLEKISYIHTTKLNNFIQ